MLTTAIGSGTTPHSYEQRLPWQPLFIAVLQVRTKLRGVLLPVCAKHLIDGVHAGLYLQLGINIIDVLADCLNAYE